MAIAKFLHTADLHLSRPFGFLPPQLAEERRRDQRAALTRIADLALDRDVDLVLVAGDLFDSSDPDPTDLEAVTKEFSRLSDAGKRIFALPGNHDYAARNSFWRRLPMPGLHVFLEPDWDTVMLDHLGIAVVGTAFDRSKSERRAFQGLDLQRGVPSIVMVHASCEVFEGQLEKYHPFSPDELSATKASYVALGHYHRYNELTGSDVAACYPGTPEGISFDAVETEDRFVVVGEIGDHGAVKFEPVKINRRVMRSASIECTSFDSENTLTDAVRKLCEPNALIQLRLSGMPVPEIADALKDLPDRFKESCLYLSMDTSGICVPRDMESDDRTIRGRFCRYMLTQIENSADPERRRLFGRALELGQAAFWEK